MYFINEFFQDKKNAIIMILALVLLLILMFFKLGVLLVQSIIVGCIAVIIRFVFFSPPTIKE